MLTINNLNVITILIHENFRSSLYVQVDPVRYGYCIGRSCFLIELNYDKRNMYIFMIKANKVKESFGQKCNAIGAFDAKNVLKDILL